MFFCFVFLPFPKGITIGITLGIMLGHYARALRKYIRALSVLVQYLHTRRVWGVRQKRFMSSCYKHWVPAQVHTVAEDSKSALHGRGVWGRH